jgi:AraC-like DNA-binding protein
MPRFAAPLAELCQGKPIWNPFIENALRASPVYSEYRQIHPRTPYHQQAGIEVHVTVEGRACFAVGDRVYHQTPRQGLVFRADTPHQFIADPAFRFQRNIACFIPQQLPLQLPADGLMSFDWLGPSRCFACRLPEAEFVRVDELFRRLRLESNLHVHGASEMCVALLVALLVSLRRHPAEHGAARAHEGANFYRQRGDLVQFASAYVQNHLADDLSLSTVSALFRVSGEHLTRSFSRQLGVSFHRHVVLQRIAAAKEMLRLQTEASVTDIAFATGFQSSSHFNKVFKAQTGLNPTEFRSERAVA